MINYTFIIPHHNCPELLNRLLDSIPKREDIEIIVVDDNSKEDRRPNISQSDVQLIIIPQEESKGAGHARNVGLSLSTGKWVLFADSDDHYVDGFINELDKFINSEADIVFFSAFIGYNKNPKSFETNYFESNMDEFNKSSKTPIDIRRFTMKFCFPWNKMYKREFLNRINAKFEEVPMRNDAWFSKYTGLNASKVDFTKKRLYCYYIYDNNTTNKKRPLKHYITTIGTSARINELVYKNGILEMGFFPGFYVKNVKRDYGLLAVIFLFAYEFLRDIYTIPLITDKMKRVIQRATKNN